MYEGKDDFSRTFRAEKKFYNFFLLTMSGFLGCFLNMYMFSVGVTKSNADLAAVFQPTTPILTGFVTVLTGIELFSWYKCVGIAVSCGGTILVMILDGIKSSDVQSFAYVAFALNASGAAAYSICQKPLIESGFKALFLTAFAMTSAFIPMTILVVHSLTNDSSQYDNFVPKQDQIVALVYCSVGISAIGYASISYANRFLDATVVNMYLILQPVSTALMSLILDINVKTSTSWSLWVSMALIFIGLYITTGLEESEAEKKKKNNNKMKESSRMNAPLLEEGSPSSSTSSSTSTSSSIDTV